MLHKTRFLLSRLQLPSLQLGAEKRRKLHSSDVVFAGKLFDPAGQLELE